MPRCQPADNGPAAWGPALSLSRSGKADLGILPRIIHGTGGSASPTGASDSPPLPGAMACRELFSCLPRSTASDKAAGATATVSEAKPTGPGCQALRCTPRHAEGMRLSGPGQEEEEEEERVEVRLALVLSDSSTQQHSPSQPSIFSHGVPSC